MPAVCRCELHHHCNGSSWAWRHSRGLHGQWSGQMFRTPLASTSSGHRPAPRETARPWKMHRMTGGRGRRYTSSSDAEGVCRGRRRACCSRTSRFGYQQFHWVLKGNSWTWLGYDGKTAFYFFDFVHANYSRCEQFDTKYQNGPMFAIFPYLFLSQ